MIKPHLHVARLVLFGTTLLIALASFAWAEVGVGVEPIEGAEILFDGTRQMLDEKWTYWKGPRYSSSLPIKWKIVDDPADKGTVVMSDDPAAATRHTRHLSTPCFGDTRCRWRSPQQRDRATRPRRL